MSTYPEEFKMLEEQNEKLRAENKRKDKWLKDMLYVTLFYADTIIADSCSYFVSIRLVDFNIDLSTILDSCICITDKIQKDLLQLSLVTLYR